MSSGVHLCLAATLTASLRSYIDPSQQVWLGTSVVSRLSGDALMSCPGVPNHGEGQLNLCSPILQAELDPFNFWVPYIPEDDGQDSSGLAQLFLFSVRSIGV